MVWRRPYCARSSATDDKGGGRGNPVVVGPVSRRRHEWDAQHWGGGERRRRTERKAQSAAGRRLRPASSTASPRLKPKRPQPSQTRSPVQSCSATQLNANTRTQHNGEPEILKTRREITLPLSLPAQKIPPSTARKFESRAPVAAPPSSLSPRDPPPVAPQSTPLPPTPPPPGSETERRSTLGVDYFSVSSGEYSQALMAGFGCCKSWFGSKSNQMPSCLHYIQNAVCVLRRSALLI
jgi:hypothetical protein